jgi:hypothetical protein
VGSDKVGADRSSVVRPDPDDFCPEPSGVPLEAGLMRHQFAVHRQDRRYFDVVGEPQGGFHRADVADDGTDVRLFALADLREGQLAGAGREILDLGAGRAFRSQQDR